MPDEQSDLSYPWNSWCCVMYSAVESFSHPMNFNNFFFFFRQRHRVDDSVSLHCRILFLLLPFRTPIATCPVEKQSKVKDRNSGGNVNFLPSAQRRLFFFLLRVKIRLMSHLRCNELKSADDNLCWVPRAEVWVKIKMCRIHHQTAVLKIDVNLF